MAGHFSKVFRGWIGGNCKGIAEFWASRVTLDNGQYVINGVIPPGKFTLEIPLKYIR